MYKNDSMKENHYELRIKKEVIWHLSAFDIQLLQDCPLGDLELFSISSEKLRYQT